MVVTNAVPESNLDSPPKKGLKSLQVSGHIHTLSIDRTYFMQINHQLHRFEQIEEVLELAQTGDQFGARDLLEDILREDPENVEAWILMARLAPDQAQALYCLQRVFKFGKSPDVIIWARKNIAQIEQQMQSADGAIGQQQANLKPPFERKASLKAYVMAGSLVALFIVGCISALVIFVIVPLMATR